MKIEILWHHIVKKIRSKLRLSKKRSKLHYGLSDPRDHHYLNDSKDVSNLLKQRQKCKQKQIISEIFHGMLVNLNKVIG